MQILHAKGNPLFTRGTGADLNLGIKTFLNGTLVSNILDTSTVATDTIDYVATDTWGNTSTSTRTVIIEAPASPAADDSATAPSPDSATTTDATSTAQ